MTENPTPPSRFEIQAFETVTRDLVGLALRSVDSTGMSLPQFRLLLVLSEIGPTSSVSCARALGVVGSSITRLADRLHASGHLERRTDPSNRSVTLLELTPLGRELVDEVLLRRRRELGDALAHLDADQRAAAVAALHALHPHIASDASHPI